jgi:pimeloyl-ACP methyl ester carboxylesterase
MARDGKPVVLFGLSVGGMLAYQCAALNRDVRGVIASCLLDFRQSEVRRRVARFEILGTWGISILEKFPFLFDSIPFPMGQVSQMSAMSNHSEFNQLVLRDRIGGSNWVPGRFLRTLFTEGPGVEPEEFKTPLLLVHPAEDQWTPYSLSQSFFERLAGPKEVRLLDGCGHAPIEEPGIFQLEESVKGFLSKLVS